MSFILDALKKSESDRQRQSGPALFEVRVAPPRTRLPRWAIAIALLLVLNLGVVLWMLLRHQTHANAPPVTMAGATAPGPVPAAPAAPPPAAPPTPAPAPASSAPPVPMVAASAAVAASAPTPAVPPAADATAPASGAEPTSPEDYAPAEEPAAPGLGSHVRRGTASGVPLYEELATTPGTHLPQLRLDLHVFAGRPEERFVMVNMHKLREGDSLPEGVHLDSITPEGAVMSYQGTKFLLPRD
jgi:general secretion pathway protein B